jgi:hypothetical protein
MQKEEGKNRGLFPSHGSEGVATVGTVPARTGSWRERQRWRVARCGGGADPLIPSGGAHPLFPLFLPEEPLFLPEEGEEQQGEEGGGGGGRGHPLFVPGEGDEQGKGKGREGMGRGRGKGRWIPSGRLLRQKSGKCWGGWTQGRSK